MNCDCPSSDIAPAKSRTVAPEASPALDRPSALGAAGNLAVQRRAQTHSADIRPPSHVSTAAYRGIHSLAQPLDHSTRDSMESRFGHDFSGVRIHADNTAAESARSINAQAYTVGRDIVFDSGRYAPGSAEGRRLVAHELTHVVQQSGAGKSAPQEHSLSIDSSGESNAEEVASRIESGKTSGPILGFSRAAIQTQPACGPQAQAHPKSECLAGTDPADPFCNIYRDRVSRERREKALAAGFPNLPAAPNAYHGIEIWYLALDSVRHDVVIPGRPKDAGRWLIVTYEVEGDSDRGTGDTIAYYAAFDKEAQREEFMIGPDSIDQFLGNLDHYAAIANAAYWWVRPAEFDGSIQLKSGQPSAREIEEAKMGRAYWAGDHDKVAYQWGKIWNMAVKDPGFWVGFAMSGVNAQAGIDSAPFAESPITGKFPESTLPEGSVFNLADHPKYVSHFEKPQPAAMTSQASSPYTGGAAALKLAPMIDPVPVPVAPKAVPTPASPGPLVRGGLSTQLSAAAANAVASAASSQPRQTPPKCGDPQLPWTEATWSGTDRGETMKALPLTKCGPAGSRPTDCLPGWDCLRNAPKPVDGAREIDFWRRAHLLHGKGGKDLDLHGPGNKPNNLIITDGSLNTLMFTLVEDDAIHRIHLLNQTLSYSVKPVHVADTGDRRYFANGMDIDLDRIDPVTRHVTERIFHRTIVSGKERPIPLNCT